MADCVHLRCKGLPACRIGMRTGLNQEVGLCEHCEMAVVFSPTEILWIAANGRVHDQITCDRSPTNKHWVNR